MAKSKKPSSQNLQDITFMDNTPKQTPEKKQLDNEEKHTVMTESSSQQIGHQLTGFYVSS
jgi:hypothetical protein